MLINAFYKYSENKMHSIGRFLLSWTFRRLSDRFIAIPSPVSPEGCRENKNPTRSRLFSQRVGFGMLARKMNR
jgi:hypothetical protein